jgi:hypothetical protein
VPSIAGDKVGALHNRVMEVVMLQECTTAVRKGLMDQNIYECIICCHKTNQIGNKRNSDKLGWRVRHRNCI